VGVWTGRVGCWSFVVVSDNQAVDVAAEGHEFAELVDAGDEESGIDRAGHVRGDGDLCHDGTSHTSETSRLVRLRPDSPNNTIPSARTAVVVMIARKPR